MKRFTLGALDDVITRGHRPDWADPRRAGRSDPARRHHF